MAFEKVFDILIGLGCDYYDKEKRVLMAQFVWLTWDMGNPVDAMRILAADRGKYYLALNSTMRGWLRPVFEASPEMLSAFGLKLRKKNPYAVASALAKILENGS